MNTVNFLSVFFREGLPWVFAAVCRLSLVAASGDCSLVAVLGFSSRGTRAQWLHALMDATVWAQ